jgi:arabinofuranan 3-O-arabinosyltransferase
VRYLLRRREKLCEAITIGVAAGGLIVAGAVLSQNPWRSVDGYVGHAWSVQLLALLSVAMLAASTETVGGEKKRSVAQARDLASVQCPTSTPHGEQSIPQT